MSDIILIRPGCTDFDEQQRIQGSLELPLNARGREQLGPLVEKLRLQNIEAVFCSTHDPAHSTAEIIAGELGIPVKADEQLNNVHQGLWEGLKIKDVRRKYPKVFKQWRESPECVCPPGGETLAEAATRVRKALQKPLKRKSGFAVVASEPLASIIRAVVLDTRPEQTLLTGDASTTCTMEILARHAGNGANGKAAAAAAPDGPPEAPQAVEFPAPPGGPQ